MIIPAIIANSFEELEKRIRVVEGHAERVHLDIMDGVFVPNKTISGYEELPKIETSLSFDVHLMVNNPENQMYFWYQTKANRFIIHAESDTDLRALVEQVRSHDKVVGIALNPKTPTDVISELIDDIDFVLFMTVEPGEYGADFVEEVVSKIEAFHIQHPSVPIMVDGGIHPENHVIPKLMAAGVSMFVAGSHVFEESLDVGKTIEELKKITENK